MHSFTNDEIDIAGLPQTLEVKFVPIDPSYRKVILWEWMTVWSIITLIVFVTVYFSRPLHTVTWISILFASTLLLSLLNLWFLLKSFYRKAYAVRDRDIIYRSGWIVQRTSVCPFNRIQHCTVTSGPFERSCKLSSLSVYTAGTDGSDMKIPGLPADTALALRDLVMKKTAPDEYN